MDTINEAKLPEGRGRNNECSSRMAKDKGRHIVRLQEAAYALGMKNG